MARHWGSVLCASSISLVSLGLFACAQPAGTSGTSGELDGPDPTHLDPTPVDAPGVCAETKIRSVRYGSTVDRSVKLPSKIAGERCYDEPYAKLEGDIACARDFNAAARGHALYQAGLAEVEMEPLQLWNEGARYGGAELGSLHPHPEQQGRQMLFLGMEESGCSGYSAYNSTGPGISLAHNQAGELVVVFDEPSVESRHYPACRCFAGCGAYQEPMPRFGLVPAGAKLGTPVRLEYPAIVISSSAVESQSCCCAP